MWEFIASHFPPLANVTKQWTKRAEPNVPEQFLQEVTLMTLNNNATPAIRHVVLTPQIYPDAYAYLGDGVRLGFVPA